MTDIKDIAEDIYNKEKTKSYGDIIANFERHKKVIDTIDYNATQDTYDIYSKLIGDYGIALAGTKSYKKAIPSIETALDLFLNNKRYTADTLPKVKLYETLIFNRGLCNYYLDKYALARPDFELLVKLYPDNSLYQKWINVIGYIKLNRLKNILWYFVAGSILTVAFLNKITLIKDIILGLGLIALLSTIVLETIIYYRKKKYGA